MDSMDLQLLKGFLLGALSVYLIIWMIDKAEEMQEEITAGAFQRGYASAIHDLTVQYEHQD